MVWLWRPRQGGFRLLSAQWLFPLTVAWVCLGATSDPAVAQGILPAAIQRGTQAAADQRAELYRQLRSQAEALELEQAMDRAWANLPSQYQWLKDWEYV